MANSFRSAERQWKQLIFHAVDGGRNPIFDFQVGLFSGDTGRRIGLKFDPEPYKHDTSFRSYHVDTAELSRESAPWHLKVWTESGSEILVPLMNSGDPVVVSDLLRPLTTTLVEVVLPENSSAPTQGIARLCPLGEWGSEESSGSKHTN